MAQVTKVELVDDLSGDKADETVTFGLDGVVYDIDLSANNAGILRDILGGWCFSRVVAPGLRRGA